MTPTIAVIDDDRNLLTSVTIALESEGFDVRAHGDAVEGLQDILHCPPDLAILDIKMPRMDGLELLRRLRRQSDLPVIFLTSKDQEVDELEGLRHGADDYVSKPFSLRLLIERIRAVMRRNVPPADAALLSEGSGELEPPLVRGALMLDTVRHACTWNGAQVILTVTEFLLLKALALRPRSRDPAPARGEGRIRISTSTRIRISTSTRICCKCIKNALKIQPIQEGKKIQPI